MTENYEKALADAESEMSDVDSRLEQLERRKAQLLSTIAGLRSLMGKPVDPEEMTLTDAIRMVFKSSNDSMTVPQVMVDLRVLGAVTGKDKTAVVATIVNRMVRGSEITPDKMKDGRLSYRWRGIGLLAAARQAKKK